MAVPEPLRPPEPVKPRGSLLPIALAGMLAIIVCTVLFFLTLGGFGAVMVVAAGVFLVGAFHYVVWGWWLSAAIREDVEADERD